MNNPIDLNDLSGTVTVCSEEILDPNTNYQDFFANIEERMWQHTNKKRFFERTSLGHYLNALSSIQSTDPLLKRAVEYYTGQLQKLKKELDEYQNTAASLSNPSINLDHLTEDQNILRNVHNPVNIEEQIVSTEPPPEELGSVMDISESLFTNNDFEYSNSKIFDNTEKDPKTTLEPEIVTKPVEIHKPQTTASRKRKFFEADLLDDFDFDFDHLINNSKIEASDTTTISEAGLESKDCDDLDKMEAIKLALNSHQYEKLYEIANNALDNPENLAVYTHHFTSLIESFRSFFIEKIDELVKDKEEKGFGSGIEGRRTLSTRSSSVRPSPVETGLTEPPMSLEDLSAIFAQMYGNLSNADD